MTKNIKLLSVMLAASLVSCSDTAGDAYTVGSEDNAIALTLGMNNSPTASTTRADEPKYVALQANTGILMRVEGTWKGHSPESIIKTTSASASAAEVSNTYNTVSSYKPTLYWDDYGTADPANTSGLEQGLAIYAVAVDGQQSAPTVTTSSSDGTTTTDQWGDDTNDTNILSWSTVEDASTSSDMILHKDLLVSNNLSGEGGGDASTPKRLTFAEHKAINKNTSDKDETQSRLVFNHVLSKITFKLKAAEGFDNHQFANTPKVELTHSKISDATQTHYCYTKGTVNIKQCKATPTETASLVTLKKTGKTTDGGFQQVTEEAIIYPGSVLLSAESDIVARVNADGNIYYVYAKQIKDAIDAALGEDANKYQAKAGYNYVFNITVNKTAINVTATVTDWTGINAEEVTPIINVSAAVGDQSTATNTLAGFSFYRMADEALVTTGVYNLYNTSFKSGDYYKEEAYGKLSGDGTLKTCTFYSGSASETPVSLYWPDHQTHYHFRGIYPETGTAATDTDKPLVVDYTKSDNTASQGILVSNAKYSSTTFPGNLLIGKPEITDGPTCGNADHTNGKGEVDMSQHGICARTGDINMNFRYMMAQVQVNLTTATDDSKVLLNQHTKVEITDAQTDGYIDLHNRTVGAYKNGKSTYALHNETEEANCAVRHDCIVPQTLGSMKFKITVFDETGTMVKDIYEATVADIQVTEGSSTKKSITSWEAGKKYVYNLKVTKTQVNVTATITDWITNNADTDIWL